MVQYKDYCSSKITLSASKALLGDRIQFRRFKEAALNEQINKLKSYFRRSTNQSEQLRILAEVGRSSKYHFLKQKEIQIRKFVALKNLHQTTVTPKAIQEYEKFALKLSEHVFTESEESVLNRGLNFYMARASEFSRSRFPPNLGMDFY
jgi:hypothetical protein